MWINKSFVPSQTVLNLTEIIYQLPLSSNNGHPCQSNAVVPLTDLSPHNFLHVMNENKHKSSQPQGSFRRAHQDLLVLFFALVFHWTYKKLKYSTVGQENSRNAQAIQAIVIGFDCLSILNEGQILLLKKPPLVKIQRTSDCGVLSPSWEIHLQHNPYTWGSGKMLGELAERL